MRPASAAPRLRERVAVIDLGGLAGPGASGDRNIAERLETAIVAAGLDPVTGDGVEDALAGRDVERDAVQLAAAMASAQRAFGALSCSDATRAAQQAIGIAAARQAAGRAVPELPRAWAYVLLCADRESRFDAALAAATQLRALAGRRPDDIPAAIWAKYPPVDAVANRELIELEIDAGVAGAAIWIDFQEIGVSPAHVIVQAGEHVIAAAAAGRRGWAAGTAIAKQKLVHVPLADVAGPWAEVARRVVGWRGGLPPPDELAWVLARVHARIAVIRRGDTIVAWGQIGRGEAPHAITDSAPIADVARVLAAVGEQIRTWTDRAPDPDQPLLVEQAGATRVRRDEEARPTKWWVYAAIAGAVAIGAGVIYLQDSASDRQRVELTYP